MKPSCKNHFSTHRLVRSGQKGLSLIELMIAMVIGLGVVGAGLAMYVTSGHASRASAATSQISEDASLVLNLMRNHIAMAGYSRPTGVTALGMTKVYSALAVFGCSHSVIQGESPTPLSCPAAGSSVQPDSIAVMYEADTENTWPTASTNPRPNAPTDCLGFPLSLIGTAPNQYFLAENRFYVSNGTLFCDGNAKSAANATLSAQPLVDNVQSMSILYGVADTYTPAGAPPGTSLPSPVAVRYLSASEIASLGSNFWMQVVSVRLCVVIRSPEPVLDAATNYINCEGTSTPPNDRRLYRAFTTTIVLNNRTS